MKRIFNSLSFFKEWFSFIKQNGAYIFFIALFYSLEICYCYIGNYDLSLHRFPGRMIGFATIKGIDIGRKTALFYNSVFLFFVVNAIFYLFAFLFTRKRQGALKAFNILNISSLGGCLLLFLQVLKLSGSESVHLIFLIQIIALVFLGIKEIFLKDSNKKLFDSALFSIVICSSICFYFLLKECTTLFHSNRQIYFSVSSIIFNSLAFFAIAFYIRKQDYLKSLNTLIKLLWVLIPFLLLPLYTVLKDEIYLILNNKGILYFSPVKLYLLLLVFTLTWIYLRSRKPVEQVRHYSLYKMLSNYYFPLLILGITAYIYYNPFFVDNSKGMFEEANRFLPVMEFLKYHTVPLLEKFNSHMLSEIITIYLYGILNKLSGLQPLIYDFIFPVCAALIAYFIIKDFTHNSYVALFTVVLFPLEKDLTVTFFPVILAVYVLYMIIYKPASFKNYLLLLCTFLFFVIWKIDIGVAGDIGILVVLLIYSFSNTIKINTRLLLIALAVFFTGILILFFLFLLNGINLISNLLNEYNYLSSVQSYGYIDLSNSTPDKVFQMQYFIFPVVALLLGMYIIFHFKKFSTSKNLKFATICLLFCIGFYIANFQRGLVRHSFVENTDEFLSSFIFFILSGSIYLIYNHQSHLRKFLLFFFVSFLLLTGFKYPECHPFVVYESMKSKLNDFPQIQPRAGIKREIDSNGLQNNFEEFQKFISTELKSDETFIDFSNEPMLYYYTHKITPSYFYQSPYSMHNDYLQNRFIENLSNYKVPLLLFANTLPSSQWFWNEPDDVPNALRHYRIAEYLYQHYEPFVVVQNYCLWKKKNSDLKNSINPLIIFKADMESTILADSAFKNKPIDSITTTSEGNIFITISYAKDSSEDYGLAYHRWPDSIIQKIEPIFSDTSSHQIYYYLSHKEGEKIKFYLKHFKNISSMEVDEVKYRPDVYSLVPQHWEIGMLPYIWANYDERFTSAPVQKIIVNTDTLINKSPISFNLPLVIDKSTGNYIVLSLDANNEAPVTVQFAYGPSNGIIDFTLPPGKGIRKFAIRISSQYNWYARENTKISLSVPDGENIHLKKMVLLKGD
jgi:hypothetical protein